jgi:hypothetical protein
MKIFLDNTAIHRISPTIRGKDASIPIKRIDALALLHLAEHIMFSDVLEVSAFELQSIIDTTSETIKLLQENDCIDIKGDLSINTIDFDKDIYKNACDKAAPKILEDLMTLNEESVAKWCRIADESTQPLGIRGSQLEKWIVNNFNKAQINEFNSNALERKSNGSYDYIIASSEAILGQLKSLTSKYKNNNQVSAISAFLDVFFRVNINRELADNRSSVYSPAPGRAITIRKSEELFRYEVEKEIEKHILKENHAFSSKFIEQILKDEILPIPMFAIHFLKTKNASSPIELLRVARELRENNKDLNSLRSWLNKWEEKYSSLDLNEKEKAREELDDIALSLSIAKQDFDLNSIFRGQASLSQDGTFSYSLDPSGLSIELQRLFIKFSRSKIFLTAIRREFEFEETLGSKICEMLNRPIIK